MIRYFAILFAVLFLSCNPEPAKKFEVHEATIASIHEAMASGSLTATELVQAYLNRIEAYDKDGPYINSLITVNEQALQRAAEIDSLYEVGGEMTGPLHGIPIVVKDNFDTHDIPTTNGTLAFVGRYPPDDAYMVRKIREAGAIVIAKANLAEFATTGAFTVSSALAGYTRNPYDTKRTTSGSSGGTAAAVAASLGTAGLGSDTGSSIRGPSSRQALVGIRSTMGLTSRDGIIPLALTNDVGGPMARTVEDCVKLFDVLVGYDPNDTVTARSQDKIPETYTAFLDKDGLKDARIGVLYQFFQPDDADSAVIEVMNQAVADLEKAGAFVDSVALPELDSLRDQFEYIPQLKRDYNNYLASRGDTTYKTLQEVYDSGDYHPYLYRTLTRTLEEGPDVPEEHPDWDKNMQLRDSLRQMVLQVMDDNNLDALVYPSFRYPPRLLGNLNTTPRGPNSNYLSPPTGFPAMVVPMGYTYDQLPAGLQMMGRPFDEPTLIKIAYAYEQATNHRVSPPSVPPL